MITNVNCGVANDCLQCYALNGNYLFDLCTHIQPSVKSACSI